MAQLTTWYKNSVILILENLNVVWWKPQKENRGHRDNPIFCCLFYNLVNKHSPVFIAGLKQKIIIHKIERKRNQKCWMAKLKLKRTNSYNQQMPTICLPRFHLGHETKDDSMTRTQSFSHTWNDRSILFEWKIRS